MSEGREHNVLNRRLGIVKLLQGRYMRVGEIAEHFCVDERTIRTDIDELRTGMDILGTKIKIESSHPSSQRHYYKSTVHPVFLGLNLSELFALLKLLEEKSDDPAAEVYDNIFKMIYSQITDYAEGMIAEKFEKKYDKAEVINRLEEEVFRFKGYNLIFWNKSGKYIEISYTENGEPKKEEFRLLSINKDRLTLENKNREKKHLNYSEVLIDWAKVDYK